ncbi:MAG: hypothetical protein LZF61_00035 [Nitrosomonas sp.]|nr:MAG: hypothetical protein LZF61_00035 [Nitrosomonas sp.]
MSIHQYTVLRILTIMTAGFFMNANAIAGWTPIGESNQKNGFTAYTDLTTLWKAGDRAKMWTLIDYKSVQKTAGVEFLSEKIRREYDCKQKQMRKLAYSFFSWNMEGGDLIRAYSQPQKWEPVTPGTIDETEWDIACIGS